MSPGSYLLEVSVEDEVGHGKASRNVPFIVE